MTQEKVNLFLAQNSKYFESATLPIIKEKLLNADDDKESLLMTIDYEDPTTILLVSIFVGDLGVDCFMLGKTGRGILKLLTGGLCGILWLIDVIKAKKTTQKVNYNKFLQVII